jgi:bifunctional DNase/RNase
MEDFNFSQVKVLNFSLGNYGFVIFLKKINQEKVLPICIGAAEVNSISAALSKQSFPRPSSHTLFKNILSEIGCKILKILVTDLKEGTYYAKLYLETKEGIIEFDSRPSDAIAMALRYDAPMFVHNLLFEEAGVKVPESEDKVEDNFTPMEALQQSLKKAVEEERYEDAMKLQEKLQQMDLDDLMNN